MPLTFLVLAHSGRDSAGFLSGLAARANCVRINWDTFSPQALDPHAHLIIADATAVTGLATSFFAWLRQNPIRTPVLAILPETCMGPVLREISRIVDDFLLSPVCVDELESRIARILGPQSCTNDPLHDLLENELCVAQLIGRHPSFQQALQQVRLFGPSQAPVLITGETGTGKELFAHAIHSLSPNRNGPFIPVNCGAIPEHLAENELFGHRRGAFTDAHCDQRGLAGMAEGGTLFLDEIDSFTLANQAKLLRFLQEGSYRAVGADRFTQAKVRVIAATNRSLEEAVRRKEFRSDLYFRLSVLRLHLPSLRARNGDLFLLAEHFLKDECTGKRKVLTPAATRKLESYRWPGNVRELFNVLQRASICSPGRQILPEHIVLDGELLEQESSALSAGNLKIAKQQMVEQFERRYISELIAKHHGNVTRAALEAGKERRAFGRLLKKYSIPRSGAENNFSMGHC